mgnify:CR=1 FL=1
MLAAVLALAVLASACGGSDSKATKTPTTNDRKAAAGEICPEKHSVESYVKFVNDSSLDVQLEVPHDSWSCAGYDGPSNPGALNGVVVEAGHTLNQRLERHWKVDNSANWSLIFRTPREVSGKCCAIVALGPDSKVDLTLDQRSDDDMDLWKAGLAGEQQAAQWSRIGYADVRRPLKITFETMKRTIKEDEKTRRFLFMNTAQFTITDG